MGDDQCPADDARPWGILHGDVWAENPRFHITAADRLMLMVWDRCRAPALGGPRALPCAGGVLDQPLVMVRAVEEMDRASANWHRHARPPAGEA